MINAPILFFSISILSTLIAFKLIGNRYAQDHPDIRKRHGKITPQIGGIIFGPLLLIISLITDIVPHWYVLGGILTIILGTIDDNRSISWQVKLFIQLIIFVYISIIFWDKFSAINFYNHTFPVSNIALLSFFAFWFIGIYNAVNLLDGLDGLAAGFMIIVCLVAALFGVDGFTQINFILGLLLLGFLVMNQRNAKLFMGDSGSLFLGYHLAVMPLLFAEKGPPTNILNTTPFVLFASYPIADTARVFFTRLASKKNPMTPDTIHFHHVILQKSGSYLASLSIIYLLMFISSIVALFAFNSHLSDNVMLIHLAFIIFFILTPPIQTYIPFITTMVKPFYTWQKATQAINPSKYRTIYIFFLLIGLVLTIILNTNQTLVVNWQHILSIILLSIVFIIFTKDNMLMYVIQIGIILLFSEIFWNDDISILTKLFSIISILSYTVFTFEKRNGCDIRELSSLDLLLIIFTICSVIISIIKLYYNPWVIIVIFSLWFNIAFILRRTIFLNEQRFS